MAVAIIIFFAALLVFVFYKRPTTAKAHWQAFLDGFHFPASEFYDQIKAGLQERQITHVQIGQEAFLEKHILSAKRVYLRITQNEFVYFVCAAPYGTGTFVSTWLCVENESYLNKIPILSKLMGEDRDNKAFYQADTERMFRTAVHTTVVATIDKIVYANGMRGLTDVEKQLADINLK